MPNAALSTNFSIHSQARGELSHHFLADLTSLNTVSIPNAVTRSMPRHYPHTHWNSFHFNPSTALTIAIASCTKSLVTIHSRRQALRDSTHLSLLLSLHISRNLAISRTFIGPHWPSSTIHSPGSTMTNRGSYSIRTTIMSSRIKFFTRGRHHPQRYIKRHEFPHCPLLWRVSSSHPTSYFLWLTPTMIPRRANGALSASLLTTAPPYLHHASRTVASSWNSLSSTTTTSVTMQQISVFGCNTTIPAISPHPPLMPQPTSFDLPTHQRFMPSVTAWSHSDSG